MWLKSVGSSGLAMGARRAVGVVNYEACGGTTLLGEVCTAAEWCYGCVVSMRERGCGGWAVDGLVLTLAECRACALYPPGCV